MAVGTKGERTDVIEPELKLGESPYYQLFISNPLATFIYDPDTLRIIDANTIATTQYQFTREEFQNMTIRDITVPEDVHSSSQIPAVDPSPVRYEKVQKHRRKDGSLLSVAVTECPLELVPNRFKIAIIEDVTDRIRAEEEKARLQTQLFQTRKMEAVGQLAGAIAHDFNNILTSLVGYGSLLEMELPEDSPSRTYVEQILSSSEKATQLTQSLLAFSKQQSVSLKPCKLNDIISGIEKLLKKLLTEDIVLKISLAPEDLIVNADIGQLDQVIINILTNARDAMPHGGELMIATKSVNIDSKSSDGHEEFGPGKYAFLSISDTGVGMPDVVKERIFDPFFTTKEVGQGTGLGLSIVYGIIKKHNGLITVSSQEYQGTTFNMYFPLLQEDVSRAKEFSRAVAKRGTETILIAEDNENVRRIAKEVLERTGYTVIEAADGDDALAKFTGYRNNIDLLLVDMIMPGKNGKEVSNEIKKINPAVKSLFMSGYPKDIIINKGIYDMSDHFLSKPLSPNELLQSVREILDS